MYDGIEAVRSGEVVRSAEVVKFFEAGELVGFVALGDKEVLLLERELEVDQMGIRGPFREVKEVVLDETGCDWAVGPTVIKESRNNDGKVEDIALSGRSGHSDAVEYRD